MPFKRMCTACSGTGLGGTCGECQGTGWLRYGEGPALPAHWAIVQERIRGKIEQIENQRKILASLDFSVLPPRARAAIGRTVAVLTEQYDATLRQPPGQAKDEYLTDVLNHFDGLLRELRRKAELFPHAPAQPVSPANVPRKPTPRVELVPVRKKVRLTTRKKKATRVRAVPGPAAKELELRKPRRNPRVDMSKVSVMTKRVSRLPPEIATDLDRKRRQAAPLPRVRPGTATKGKHGGTKQGPALKRASTEKSVIAQPTNPALRDEFLRAMRASQIEERKLDGSKDWHAWRETGSGQFGSYPSFDADPE